MNNEFRISYWLVPSDRDILLWKNIITTLSVKYGGPIFLPHVTFYTGYLNSIDESAHIIEKHIIKIKPLVLEPINISFSDSFVKSCYLEFAHSDDIVSLFSCITNSLPSKINYEISPHMSLFYGSLSVSDQLNIRNSIPAAGNIYFDRINIVHTGKPTKTPADVDSWIPLRGFNLLRN